MQAILETAPLKAALTFSRRGAERSRKNSIPILSNVRVTGTDHGVRLTTTDLDRAVIVELPGSADAGFDTTMPVAALSDLVKRAAGTYVGFDMRDDGVVLEFEAARAALPSLPVTDFPEFPGLDGDGVTRFEIMSDTLANLLQRSQFAISTEATRYYLNGVLLQVRGDELRAVATDGHRLAWLSTPLPAGAEGMADVIIPAATVGHVLALIGKRKPPVPVRIAVTPQRVEFSAGIVTVRSKTIDGTFPDYVRVTPVDQPIAVKVRADLLAAAVDSALSIHTERGRAVRLEFRPDDVGRGGSLTVSASASDGAAAKQTIPVNDVSGMSGELVIGFNGAYVLDILAAIAGETVEIRMTDPGSPAVWTDPADAAARFVQMPMRV